MAEQKSIDNNSSSNNNNNDDKSVKEIPLTRAEYLKSEFALTPEKVSLYLLKESIRRCEEREKRRQEGSDDSDEACDEEEYKPFFRNKVDCLVKPHCGHDAWVRYRNKLALKKAEAAAAAAAAACHDDDVDAPGGPKKKLKVHQETTSTQKEKNTSHSTLVWTRMLLRNTGNDLLKPQDSAKASGMDKQIKVTLG